MVPTMNAAATLGDWTGRSIDGRFTLLQWLGSSGAGAVFLTELEHDRSQKAVIKLIPKTDVDADAEARLACWAATAALSHPHLMRLFHAGRCQIDGAQLFYVVTEHAEQDLSQILPHRPLTPAETREMLDPVLEALTYLHGHGLVHTRLKPSNIMVVDDQLKLSTDSLQTAGESGKPSPVLSIPVFSIYDAPEHAAAAISPAADIWSLGVTLVEALTQHPPVWDRSAQTEPVVPASIPEPFASIAKECLRLDPRRRCTLSDIKNRLDPDRLEPAPPLPIPASQTASKVTAKGRRAALVAAVLFLFVVVVALLLRSHQTQPSPPIAEQPPVVTNPAPPPPSPAPEIPASKGITAKGAVAERVQPDILPSAIHSINGHVAVGIRVAVDPGGNVSNATFASQGPSRYFARMALEAAQRWKFTPAQVDGQAVSSEWILHFQFTPAGTQVTPVETSP
jgi:TonB family protein